MTLPRVGAPTLVLAGVALILISTMAEAAELSLHDAVVRALEFAPTVDQARAQSDFSHAKVREQFSPLLPSVQAGTEYYQAPGYNPIITNRGLSAGMLALNYTAWDWGRRNANWRAAKYANEIAALGIVAARAQTVFDTIVAYDDLVRARAAERELGQNLDRLSRYFATVQQLRTSGRAKNLLDRMALAPWKNPEGTCQCQCLILEW